MIWADLLISTLSGNSTFSIGQVGWILLAQLCHKLDFQQFVYLAAVQPCHSGPVRVSNYMQPYICLVLSYALSHVPSNLPDMTLPDARRKTQTNKQTTYHVPLVYFFFYGSP